MKVIPVNRHPLTLKHPSTNRNTVKSAGMGRTMEAGGEEAEISVSWLVRNDLRCENPAHKAPTAGVG